MDTVTIGFQQYAVYANVEAADLYLVAATHSDPWLGLDSVDDKKRLLVTSTRILNRQVWASAYDTEAKREGIPNIIDASIELALALISSAEVQDNQTTLERIRSLTAGSVSISNFRGIDFPMRFPLIVQELLKGYLGGSDGAFTPAVSGVDDKTVFPQDLGFTTGIS